jgi:hypothetical protein
LFVIQVVVERPLRGNRGVQSGQALRKQGVDHPSPTRRSAICRSHPGANAAMMFVPRESGPDCPSVSTNLRSGQPFLHKVPRMIVYTVKQNENGLWNVSYMGVMLADGLHLGPAITQARDAARTEHLDSGLATRVEMHDANAIVPLARYQKPQGNWTGATA